MYAWGVHMQGTHRGYTCKAHMGVHTQGECGGACARHKKGGACARHAWGCTCNVHVGGACTMHTWRCTLNACMGVKKQCTHGVHMQGMHGGSMCKVCMGVQKVCLGDATINLVCDNRKFEV